VSEREQTAEKARRPLRRRIAHHLRYSGKPGTRRLAEAAGSRDWQHAVMALTGTEWGGNYDPPNAGTTRYPWADTERVFAALNDGTELWFGYSDHWEWHIGGSEVRRLTRFLIWDWWIKARWLGLRRPIYYKALHSSVNRRRRIPRGQTP
jgi:hypothetical protein